MGILLNPHRAGTVPGNGFREIGLQGSRMHELMFKQISGLNEGSGSEVHECRWERRKIGLDHYFSPWANHINLVNSVLAAIVIFSE